MSVIVLSNYDQDAIVCAAWRVSRRCVVAHAHTSSDDAFDEQLDRLSITPDWRTPCGWGGHLDRLLQYIEKSSRRHKLLVIDAFDDIKTPREHWGDVVGYAKAKDMTVWCCAQDRKILKCLAKRGATMTLEEAEAAVSGELRRLSA